MGSGGNPIDATGSTTSLSVDIYGYFNGAYRSHVYMTAYESSIRLNYSALGDVTYYYSSRPDYLDMSYTWPSLGPNYTTSCSQSIPAYNRYFMGTKTYLSDPTSKPLTYGGPLPYSQTWSGSHTLTGDITVPSNMTLTIQEGATINLNGYSLTSTGGTIVAQSNVTWQPENVKLLTGTTLNAHYCSIHIAFANAVSGQTVKVGSGAHTLTGDVTVPANIALIFEPDATVNIAAGKKITVQSALIAEGTIYDPITFDKSGSSKWWGIKFEDSSDDNDCILKHCTIQNASYGVYCYKASPAIEYCDFNNNTIGIYTSYGTINIFKTMKSLIIGPAQA